MYWVQDTTLVLRPILQKELEKELSRYSQILSPIRFSSFNTFIHAFIHSSFLPFNTFIHPLILLSILSFNTFIHAFITPSILLIHAFIHSSFLPFNAFIHPFILLIHAFIHFSFQHLHSWIHPSFQHLHLFIPSTLIIFWICEGLFPLFWKLISLWSILSNFNQLEKFWSYYLLNQRFCKKKFWENNMKLHVHF